MGSIVALFNHVLKWQWSLIAWSVSHAFYVSYLPQQKCSQLA